ncbi:unnamed protein product, partial [marine sediment metagenome]
NEGDGAFYGPKLDFHIKDAIGRTWQCGTIQLDFAMPERFDLSYIGEDGERHCPVMLHRVVLGSLERFIGILLEHTAGALPVWLAPIQVQILPITQGHEKFAQKVLAQIKEAGGRAEILHASETLGKRIRTSQMQKIPFAVIIGDEEIKKEQLTVRKYGEQKDQKIKIKELLKLLKK